MTCTRCGDCVDACPHHIVFPLSSRLGVQVAGTPALDLLDKGCHLCDDWPCVEACKPRALVMPEVDADDGKPNEVNEPDLPLMALARVDMQTCLPYIGPECCACRGVCPVPNAMSWETEQPHINPDLCVGCALCREACILDPKAITIESKYGPPSA
jgi:ferredoxin-type protein NapG